MLYSGASPSLSRGCVRAIIFEGNLGADSERQRRLAVGRIMSVAYRPALPVR